MNLASLQGDAVSARLEDGASRRVQRFGAGSASEASDQLPCLSLPATNVISTRRFSARCSGVSLATRGCVSACPLIMRRAGSTPAVRSSCATDAARAAERSQLERYVPPLLIGTLS